MRIGIIGAGAIGCLFAVRLKCSGNDVLLVHKDRGAVSEIRKNGVSIRESNGKVIRVRIPTVMAPATLLDFDVVLFAVKAHNTENAARQHAKKIGRQTTILTLQNGLGNLQVLARVFGSDRVVAGSTTEAALLLRPGSVIHTGTGRTVVGGTKERMARRVASTAAALRRAGFQVSISRNVEGVIWSKAIINAAINPLSALTRLRNGELKDVEGLSQIMLVAVREGVEVSKAEHVKLEPSNLEPLLYRVLKASAPNQSSMLQDIEKRRKTEIRQLNGAIAELARKHGIATTWNALLTSLVLGLERSYLN